MRHNIRLVALWAATFFLSIPFVQAQQLPGKRSAKRIRESFDGNWQFHKGNIAMKRVIKEC